jgi:hypothetical protein
MRSRLSFALFFVLDCLQMTHSDTFIEQLSFGSISMSCRTKQIRIESVADFSGSKESMNCQDWVLTLAINGSTKLRETMCSTCSDFGGKPSARQPKSNSTFRQQCLCTTDIAVNSANNVTFSLGPEKEQPNRARSISSTFAIPCSDNPLVSFDNDNETMPTKLPPALPAPSHWRHDSDLWIQMFWGCYQRIARSMPLLYNLSEVNSVAGGPHPLLMMPVFVMSLPHRVDRRRHMEALLPALGFRPPVFPRMIAAADIDIEGLIRAGRVSRAAVDAVTARRDKGAAAIAAYVAHALSVLDVLRDAVAAGLDWFLVAEDDLMPAASLEEVRPPARLLIPRKRAMAEARQDGWEAG